MENFFNADQFISYILILMSLIVMYWFYRQKDKNDLIDLKSALNNRLSNQESRLESIEEKIRLLEASFKENAKISEERFCVLIRVLNAFEKEVKSMEDSSAYVDLNKLTDKL